MRMLLIRISIRKRAEKKKRLKEQKEIGSLVPRLNISTNIRKIQRQ